MNKFRALLLIFSLLVFVGQACFADTAQDVARKHEQAKAQIKRLKWLESVETNKLYKNQEKLEKAKNTLAVSTSKLETAQTELKDAEYKLFRAMNEYKELNDTLKTHVRNVYKIKRRAICELLMNAGDINVLVDRLYFQKVILKKDFEQMTLAKQKAHEVAVLKSTIEMRKQNLEQQRRNARTQQAFIQTAINNNEKRSHRLLSGKCRNNQGRS